MWRGVKVGESRHRQAQNNRLSGSLNLSEDMVQKRHTQHDSSLFSSMIRNRRSTMMRQSMDPEKLRDRPNGCVASRGGGSVYLLRLYLYC